MKILMEFGAASLKCSDKNGGNRTPFYVAISKPQPSTYVTSKHSERIDYNCTSLKDFMTAI